MSSTTVSLEFRWKSANISALIQPFIDSIVALSVGVPARDIECIYFYKEIAGIRLNKPIFQKIPVGLIDNLYASVVKDSKTVPDKDKNRESLNFLKRKDTYLSSNVVLNNQSPLVKRPASNLLVVLDKYLKRKT